MSLIDLELKIAINTSKDDLIGNFFVPLLRNSNSYDRGVGYFSSMWIKEAFQGMYDFAMNGGKARWITSPILSKNDWDALLLGDKAKSDEIVKRSLDSVINNLKYSLQHDTLNAFAWMVSDGIIQFKLAKPRNKLTNEFHAKVGIFTDSEGNSVSFDGSYNDSENGLHNFESIKVFRSWDQSRDYVEQEKLLFNQIWDDEDENIDVYDIPSAVKANILELRENYRRPYDKPGWLSIKGLEEPELPSPTIPNNIELRDYQSDAIDCWFNNKNLGVFEMATGTGKTITALAAAAKLFAIEKKLFTVIICPYIHLCEQWKTEAEHFGFRPILAAESKNKWLEDVTKIARDFSDHRITQASVITTNASFLKGNLREIFDHYNIWDNMLFIADEMHHCGSQEMLKILPYDTPYRLGLSATPIRDYDELGSEILISFFGEIVYKFDLKMAIEQGFLTPYIYNPIPVSMTSDEFDEYIALTKKLINMHSDPKQPISEAALMIAIKRARVLNNSVSKIDWVRNNIASSDNLKYTLFYVGDKIFDEILKVLGFEKQLLIHEFTHRQNLKQRSKLLSQFADGKIQAFVAMKCLDEGVDVPPTRTAYFLASSSISREFIQRRGRILRNFPGKKHATIYDLISVPPAEYMLRGKDDESYKAVRSAIRREYQRMKEFSDLALNKHQSLEQFLEIANRFDLLDI